MLPYDPVPWLMAQEALPAVRARRVLHLEREGDEKAIRAVVRKYRRSQRPDGSFSDSPMKTAGVLNLLDDLKAADCGELVGRAGEYLISVVESQPGYERARKVRPGTLRERSDLCDFFGPDRDRLKPDVLARNAREANFFGEFEPLMGPSKPLRGVRRGSFDRPGPWRCFTWGLLPLCYTLEALFRTGHGRDARLKPAINALLGAERANGGWCACGAGKHSCTRHAVRALAAHPRLKKGRYAQRAVEVMRGSTRAPGKGPFAALQAVALFDSPVAREILREGLAFLAPKQKTNGTFGTPCRIERVAAVLIAKRALESPRG